MKNPQRKNELRCRRCSRLLMKGEVKAIEIKCPKCGFLQAFKELSTVIKKIAKENF